VPKRVLSFVAYIAKRNLEKIELEIKHDDINDYKCKISCNKSLLSIFGEEPFSLERNIFAKGQIKCNSNIND